MLDGDPLADAVRLHRSIAYVPGDVTLWPNLTGGEAIDILCRLSGPLDPGRKQVMLDRFDLDPTRRHAPTPRATGRRSRWSPPWRPELTCCCSTSRPRALDPLMEAAFTESIREVKAEGRSVLLSSHIFAEVERLADQVTIIREGVTVESGTIAELRHLTRSQLTVGLDHGADGLAAMPGVHDLQQLDGHVTFAVDDAELARRARRRRRPRAPVPGGQPAVPRGAVPAPLRHRARRAERWATDDRDDPSQRPGGHRPGRPATGLRHAGRHRHDGPAGRAAQPRPPGRVVGGPRRAVRLRRGRTTRTSSPRRRPSTTSRP